MVPFAATLTTGARRAAYNAAQGLRVLWYTGHYAAGRRRMGPLTEPGEPPYAGEFDSLDRTRLKKSFRELFKTDWRNIEEGVYKLPHDMLRPPSLGRLWRMSRDYLRDVEKVARRKHAKGHSEVLRDDLQDRYPRYYLQNFHYQTDGWFSHSAAERYDMQVETLFTGAADAMRRQALPAIRAALEGRDAATARLLDLGSGAGRFLTFVKDNWPALDLTALDLSPAFLGKAQTTLARFGGATFVEANAEDTGLNAAGYDIVTAVYLFHELPPRARENVAKEIARLLKPGGTFILVDTIQYGDEPGFDILLENFPRGFHEPYYDGYCRTNLADLFGEAGLVRQADALAFLTKITVFSKN